MARSNHIVSSLIAGEASPKFFGRTDTAQYNQACEDTLNSIIHPQGGAGRRPGTIHVGNLSTSSKLTGTQSVVDARNIPFSASNGKKFIITLMRVYDTFDSKYHLVAQCLDTANLYAEVTCTFSLGGSYGVVPTTDYDYYAQMTINLHDVQYAQSGDIMVLTGVNFEPMVLGYTAASNILAFRSLSNTAFHTSVASYLAYPFDAPFTLTGGNTFTVTAAGVLVKWNGSLALGGGYLEYSWVGRIIKFSAAADTIVIRIDTNDGAGNMTGTVLGGVMAATPTTFGNAAGTSYEFSSWSPDFGYPRAVTFFETRLGFGGNAQFPDTLWWSQQNQIYHFMVRKLEQDPTFADAIAESDSFEASLKADIVGSIQWISPGRTIVVGTNFREFVCAGPDATKSIGPTNFQSVPETPHGSAYVQAIRVENTTVFLQRHRRALRELVFSLEEDSFQAADLNVIGEHMARKSTFLSDDTLDPYGGNFRQMVMQQAPFPIIWCRDNNGMICGLTRDRTQQVAAWHYHEIGGTNVFDVSGTEIKVRALDICTLQVPGDVEQDEMWLIVARGVLVAGVYVEQLFLERMGKEWEGATIGLDDWTYQNPFGTTRQEQVPVFMDGTVLQSSAALDWTALSVPNSSEGHEVSVVVNGIYFGEYTVTAAHTIDLSADLTAYGFVTWKALIGTIYSNRIVPVTPEVPASLGSSQGQPRSTDRISIHFYRSIGAKFGRYDSSTEEDTPEDDLEEISFAEGESSDEEMPLFTGEKSLTFPASIDSRPKVVIQSDLPFPMHVTHIVAHGVVYE